MDGGSFFLPQPCFCGAAFSVVGSSVATGTGAAKTTAVADIVAGVVAPAKAAPGGSRMAGCFAFWTFRRTGANARAADHPLEDSWKYQRYR